MAVSPSWVSQLLHFPQNLVLALSLNMSHMGRRGISWALSQESQAQLGLGLLILLVEFL